MYHCNDYRFVYKSVEAKTAALKKYAEFWEIEWKEDHALKISRFVLIYLSIAGFEIGYRELDVYPKEKEEDGYNPEVFLLLAPFLEKDSYMKIYNDEDGEVVLWQVDEDEKVHIYNPQWEEAGLLVAEKKSES